MAQKWNVSELEVGIKTRDEGMKDIIKLCSLANKKVGKRE